ncbi:hypothetical protein [Glycomyces arizonensis]|uniref:hypothetical protein n=1 Tax=Glycomyces arizonensis TaxID=256035 RepID=UPI00040B88CF|nr:hypothetical protein [Glycomyces arizonensis]
MDRLDVPDDYEERLAAGRRAIDRLPAGAARDSARRAVELAPARETVEAARQRADRAEALLGELTRSTFDGTDPERVVWLRLDYTGRLTSLAFSPTIDRLSNPVVAGAVVEAWAAAEAARAGEAARLERVGAALYRGGADDPGFAVLRAQLDARAGERVEHTDADELCSAEVDLEGRLTECKFLVPNATLDYDCETLAAETAAVIRTVQERAAAVIADLVARCFGEGKA